ncbi:two-component sensor histidine kinase [Streptomyces cinnamoneus]|uniref:histidine kinase n=2 Tax=Streptomyces cinnamoneus TaxID=53446 RepID=A0A2G1XAS4_STRCJ|nr:two-component sensor histidine kinase [Streptomyces cinnamoneus]PPT16750.1 two-component sensor histidine kinase [Streptomyces cinnamoneus]
MAWLIRLGLAGLFLWQVLREGVFRGWGFGVLAAGVLLCAVAIRCCYRTTLERRLWTSVGLLAVLVVTGAAAQAGGSHVGATGVWCVAAAVAVERLPLGYGLALAGVAMGAYALVSEKSVPGTAGTVAGVLLIGYALRLDEEARGAGFRLLAQERAARRAEAESAALAERARIAREIHDVLAHSLSAQLVHLEAARLLIESGAERQRVLERVTAARGMAREGLAETRQALSALRGEMTRAEDFLREVTATEGARLEVTGEARTLPAEAGLAVRRAAQEALTNVRKHAPGAQVEVRFTYLEREVELWVRDGGARAAVGGLAASGAGYGLLGMRERAELLGGTLEAGPAGPDEEGFVVCLRVPA